MRNLITLLLIFFAIISCRDKIGTDNPAGDQHTHTHVEISSNGFPTMLIPNNNPLSVEGIDLGRKLFYDPVLSGDSTQSCSSCHQQKHAFSDPKQFSVGIDGLSGGRNASAIINAGWQSSVFWDGRVSSLEEQALGPIPNPIEMHLDWDEAIVRLNNSDYKDLFKLAFGDEVITKELVAMAIAQFERTLISDNAKFDKFLTDELTLSPLEAAGFNLFFSEKAECFHCHGRPLFTDDDLHNNGLDEVFDDIGQGEVTGENADRGKFRTPTLRNIEFTAPYMHDGRFNTLEEVIDFYSDSIKTSSTVDPLMPNDNGGFHWTALEKLQLVSFLKTLSDTSFISNPDFQSPYE